MAHLTPLMAGFFMFAGAHASDVADRSTHQGFLSQYMGSAASKTSVDDYNKFVIPRFNHMKPKIVDKEEERAVQKVLATDNSMPIGMSTIGVSLLALAAMLGVRMRRGLQQATAFASSGGHESDMSTALTPAAAGNILELKTQESSVRGQVGWSQQSSKNSHPLTLCYADYTLDDTPIGGPLEPTSNYILVRIDDGIDATKGGVFLPDQAKEKPSAGVVVAAGPGKAHPDTGVVVPIPVAEGDRVLYGKFDGTSVKYCGTDHQLIENGDILLSWAGDAAMSLGNVKCVADNVLVQVTKFEEETSSGIALAAGVSDQTRTSTGTVVKTGTGRIAADGASVPVPVAVGESVKFRDYAGSDVRLDGEDYIVVRVPDCLAKWTE